MSTSTRNAPSVGIVGAGFGGLGTGIALRKVGITDFKIFDRGDSVGGVWRANTYPGAACDVPSHLYSLRSARGTKWPRRYAEQPAILQYMREVVDEFDLAPHLRLNTTVTKAQFDNANKRWTLTTDAGETHDFDILVTACGQLTNPVIPPIPGLDRFAGHQFHSARWDHDYDLSGKRVAVIGTGASAIQFVPEVAKQAAHTTVFQRSAPYTLPRMDRKYFAWERWLFEHFPPRTWLPRLGWFVFIEYFTRAFINKPWATGPMRAWSNWHRRHHLGDRPDLMAKCTPDYAFGCNRVLFTTDWFKTLKRDDVSLVDRPAKEITGSSVIDADGNAFDVDAIIFGTGFAGGDFVAPMDIVGADGQHLDTVWGDTPAAHLGITVPRFPNLFILYGPNTNHGSASVPYTLECQIRYLMDAIKTLRRGGHQTLDVQPAALGAWRAEMDARSQDTAWTTGGCGNWYVNERGENTNNWPGSWLEYRRRTKKLDAENYAFS